MTGTNQFLINHGLPILFVVVLLEQLGLPIPGVPWLLAAGALAAAGHFNAIAGLILTAIACLIADFVWFYLGKFRGARILKLLCRFSLEPDTCVRSSVNVFHRYGWRGILIAKFIPGMSTVTPPLAGLQVRLRQSALPSPRRSWLAPLLRRLSLAGRPLQQPDRPNCCHF